MWDLYRILSNEPWTSQTRITDFAEYELVDYFDDFGELEYRVANHYYDDLDFDNAFWERSEVL